MHILRRATNKYRRGDNDNATDHEVLVAAGCYTIDLQVAMRYSATLRVATSWTTTLRRDLAWLDRTEARGEFSDPHVGDCSDWVAFALLSGRRE